MRGIVKWFSAEKGFGFVIAEDGSETYVRESEILMSGFRSLSEGQRVSFEVADTPDGPEAVQVVPLTDSPSAHTQSG